ncbi:MAG: glycosyltransferase [Actinomycetota bacterium]|jgi:UDP-N-acetylglucosamine:LPS N-acetylglucosamine transferase|nr:glycosyltransferase [Actinomycetota bacterium]
MLTTPLPARVLILSADMGEGHNAAARALTEVMEEIWPGVRVEQLDTVELRGSVFARLTRWLYEFQLRAFPWSYQLFYDVLCRSDAFARPLKTVTSWFFGQQLERRLAGRRFDVIISTYPLGSGALDWLRRKRGLTTPTATFIPAFHVHPWWAYAGIDLHFVMYADAARDARTPGVETGMRVGAPMVRRGFGGLERADARRALALGEDELVLLVTGGAWGLGGQADAVAALVAIEPPVTTIVVCGRNEELRRDLEALDAPPKRLRVLGFVDDMPQLMAASDVVVTNGAGVTVLEALRSARPVIAFNPLAGHGRAATAVMVGLGLAIVCDGVDDLVRAVTDLVTDPALMARFAKAGEGFVEGKDLRRDLGIVQELFAARLGQRV